MKTNVLFLVRLVKALLGGHRAVTTTEYATMIALILLVAIASISIMGEQISNLFTSITTSEELN